MRFCYRFHQFSNDYVRNFLLVFTKNAYGQETWSARRLLYSETNRKQISDLKDVGIPILSAVDCCRTIAYAILYRFFNKFCMQLSSVITGRFDAYCFWDEPEPEIKAVQIYILAILRQHIVND